MIQFNQDLAPLTSLHLNAYAHAYVRVENLTQLQQAIAWAQHHTSNYWILGGGSNTVFSQNYPGLVIHLNLRGRELAEDKNDAWIVRAYAGENWHELVDWTLQQGYLGLENLALIPGSVGAAPIQNIGAYGLELQDRFHSLEAYDPLNQRTIVLSREDCQFGYRDSYFKKPEGRRLIILAVNLRLPKPWQAITHYKDVREALQQKTHSPTPHEICDAVITIRQNKLPDPAQIGNAGSFFKNPCVTEAQLAQIKLHLPQVPAYPNSDGSFKLAAGYLIEQAGWKGIRRGDVGVHSTQALVLVNYGNASGTDLLDLAHAIQADILQRYDVHLDIEPAIV